MAAVETKYRDRDWTWANNWDGESFVEERLDRFLISPEWIQHYPNTVVQHILKQTSDHSLLLLENKPQGQQMSRRFYFDKQFLDLPDVESVIQNAWNSSCLGSPMFQTCSRIKQYRLTLLRIKRDHQMNSQKCITDIKRRIASLQLQGQFRDWIEWKQLQHNLSTTYKIE